jgi:ubiquitin carboxyl-terminal hydrolase 9/24
MPFGLVSCFLKAIAPLRLVLKPEYGKLIAEKIRGKILGRLTSLNEKDIKDVNKDEVQSLIFGMQQFLKVGFSFDQCAAMIETIKLQMALRYLRSSNLEKRLRGVSDIKNMIEQVIQSAYFAKKKAEKAGTEPPKDHLYLRMLDDDEEEKDKKATKKVSMPSQFMIIDSMRAWLLENKILENVLGDNSHIELVKRAAPIVKFLIIYGKMNSWVADAIWKCQDGKHEEMVRSVYGLIREVDHVFDTEIINEFFKRIYQVPREAYDTKFMDFLKDLTKTALACE